MTEGEVKGIHGEYRRLSSPEMGLMIRMFREGQGMKRAALAAEANMSEKTLERAESGEGVSEASCRRIARALGIREDLFTTQLYVPTREEAERLVKQRDAELRSTHRAMDVAELKSVRDVLALFRAEGYWADDQHVAEEHLEDFADLKQAWWDWNAVASELPERELVSGARAFLDQVRDIEARGYVVKAGVTQRRYCSDGRAFSLAVAVAFKKPRGNAGTPSQVWVPKRMKMSL